MLKGVNRQVLEVNRPESRYFERILFVVKPEFSALPAAKLLKEAERQVDVHRGKPPRMRFVPRRGRLFWAAGIAAAVALAAILVWVLLK